jgi:hypothetical protein
MLVTMKRLLFDSLDDVELGKTCIEPTIQEIRGKDLTVKARVYAQLTIGQRALLMFWVLYGHSQNGVTQFYCEVDYLLSQAEMWSELKAGMRFFGDVAMLGLLEEMERVYRVLESRISHDSTTRRNVSAEDIGDDAELHTSVCRLDARYHEIAPATLKRVCTYIRNNPGAFMQIED